MSRDESALLDMLAAARLIVDFRGSLTREQFERDSRTRSAVLHQLLVLGEAAKRVSVGTRSAYPQVPWQFAAGMRDRLIHGYDDVDDDQVWATVSADIPTLIADLEAITKGGDEGPPPAAP